MAHVIWEQCVEKEICVHIPIIGKKCVGVSACLSLVEDGGRYKLEISAFGQSTSIDIAQGCFPVISVGFGSIEVCLEPRFEGGALKGLRLLVRACVNVPIIGHRCIDLIGTDIGIFKVASLSAAELQFFGVADVGGWGAEVAGAYGTFSVPLAAETHAKLLTWQPPPPPGGQRK